MLTNEDMRAALAELRATADKATREDEVKQLTSKIASLTRTYRNQRGIGIPMSLVEQAKELDPGFVSRPHIDFLSDRIGDAVRDVERGHNRRMAVSLPPRAGKSTLLSLYGPLWLLRRHPEWKLMLTSHDGTLSGGWARQVRQMIEDRPSLGIALRPDGGAGATWSTVEGGGMLATSVRGSLTGRGARVLFIDDPIKDFVDAHSARTRQALWDWWLSVAQTRLEPPYLVVVIGTRWHQEDMIGRLFSDEFEGDPRKWSGSACPRSATSPTILSVGRRATRSTPQCWSRPGTRRLSAGRKAGAPSARTHSRACTSRDRHRRKARSSTRVGGATGRPTRAG